MITKDILQEYQFMKQEIVDVRDRISGMEREIKEMGNCESEILARKKALLEERRNRRKSFEVKLLEQLNEVEDFVMSIESGKLRQIFILKYVDGLTWAKVAMAMNYREPNKRRMYSGDSCRLLCKRYLMKIESEK